MNTAARIAFVSDRATRMTVSQIAHYAGTTKGAITGFAYRHKIELRSGETGGVKGTKSVAPPKFSSVLNHDPISLIDLTPRSCRWPVDTERGIMFCGLHTEGRYCETHHKRAYRSADGGV